MEFDYIHTYTRADAIRDGFLVDVSGDARSIGFKYPVALTQAVWLACVEWDAANSSQNEEGRLYDILFVASIALRKAQGSQVSFTLKF